MDAKYRDTAYEWRWTWWLSLAIRYCRLSRNLKQLAEDFGSLH